MFCFQSCSLWKLNNYIASAEYAGATVRIEIVPKIDTEAELLNL